MERRTDYRHGLRYELAIAERSETRCSKTGGGDSTGEERRVLVDLKTSDVSASGLSFSSSEPHGLMVGDRFEVRLLAETRDGRGESSILMSTDATLIRATERDGAVTFDRPLKY